MMNHPEFPVVSFLLIPLLLCSLPSHIRAGSISLISLCLWLLAANLIHGVNSLVWAGNVNIQLVVWCDITMNILVGFTAGVPLSVLCVSRQLESISSNRQAIFTPADKRRRMKVEFVLCFIVPLFWMALHYIFQGHRFDIIEDIGCNPTTYISIPTIICYSLPPVLISFTSMGFSLAAVHHFLKKRIEFASMLRSSRSAMTPSRYFRLLLFAFSDIFVNAVSTSLVLYFNVASGVRPYVSWAFVHFEYSDIRLFPRILIPDSTFNTILFGWWVTPVGSCIFFVLFSFGQEAVSDYVAAWNWVRKSINRIIPKRTPGLPLHTRNTLSHRFTMPRASSTTLVRPRPWDEESSMKEGSLAHVTKPGSTSETLAAQTIIDDAALTALPDSFTLQLPHPRPSETLGEQTISIPDHDTPLRPPPVHFRIQLPNRPRPFSVHTL